jgi:anti-sigma regulatory factor (Ser/Thr protein kinase)
MPVRVSLPATLENLHRLMAPVLVEARARSLAGEKLNGLELALEEVLVNICTHGYPQAVGPVSIACGSSGEELVVRIEDEGAMFDITAAAAPDLDADLLDRPVGGLGVHLVKSLMDAVSYRREDNRNVVELRLKLTKSDGRKIT